MMDRKTAFEEMLSRVDEDKRDEAYAKLAAAKTRDEKFAIFESYGVTVKDVFGQGWAEEGRELTNEELEEVAGGGFWEETWNSRDCNCEP